MNKIYNCFDTGFSLLATAFAIDNIEQTLSIVILIISILNILVKSLCRIIIAIKEKNLNKVIDVVEETNEEIGGVIVDNKRDNSKRFRN